MLNYVAWGVSEIDRVSSLAVLRLLALLCVGMETLSVASYLEVLCSLNFTVVGKLSSGVNVWKTSIVHTCLRVHLSHVSLRLGLVR